MECLGQVDSYRSLLHSQGVAKQHPAEDTERQPEYAADGVDVSLIRWMLSLSPAERLRYHDQQMSSMEKLRGVARKQLRPDRTD